MRKADIGFFSPFAYVKAKTAIPELQYLVSSYARDRSGRLKDSYRGVIITKKTYPFKSLEELSGRRFAFTDYTSTSGYLFPLHLLKSRGIDPNRFFSKVFMLKKHDRITAALAENLIEAGATWTGGP